MSSIKTIANISPLIGLLGTVLGVLSAFNSIEQSGLKNPTLFAGGISMALITTVGGLVVSITHYVFYGHLSSCLNDFEVELENNVIVTYLGEENAQK